MATNGWWNIYYNSLKTQKSVSLLIIPNCACSATIKYTHSSMNNIDRLVHLTSSPSPWLSQYCEKTHAENGLPINCGHFFNQTRHTISRANSISRSVVRISLKKKVTHEHHLYGLTQNYLDSSYASHFKLTVVSIEHFLPKAEFELNLLHFC